MNWQLQIADRARKSLARLPARDRDRVMDTLDAMLSDPFGGDIVRLKNQPAAWRRRVGSYRILFDIYPERRVVDIVDIARRTSTTY